jgi:hypothetical protein
MQGRADDDCGCCEDLGPGTPILVYNRPGLSKIRYRTGTHSRFKQSMLAGLSDANRVALSSLKIRENDDFSIALLDSWATVADVLTFYQERIATESYLRTATQRESILQLSRLIGYELRPGVASSTYLAFCLETAEGAPESAVIDMGTKVQSIPGPGRLPSIFEVVESITAWPSLNELKPLMTMRQEVKPSSERVRFEGMSTGLKPGDGLLFNLKAGEEFFCQVESIRLLPDRNQTEAKMQKQVLLPQKSPPIREKTVVYDQAAMQSISYQDANPGKFSPLGKMGYSKSSGLSSLNSRAAIPSFEAEAVRSSDRQFMYEADVKKAYQRPAKIGLYGQLVEPADFLVRFQMFPGYGEKILAGQAELPRQGSFDLPAGVTVFRSRAYIFGHNAPRFDSLPNSMKYGEYIKDKDDTILSTHIFKDSPYRDRRDSWVDTTLDKYKIMDNKPAGASLFLDSIYPVQRGGIIILRDGDAIQPYKVDEFWDVSKSDFTLTAKVRALALTTEDKSALCNFTVRGTTVFCQGEELILARVPYDDPYIADGSIKLDGYLYRLRRNQPIIVCGKLAMDLKDNPSSCELAFVSNVRITAGPEGFTTIYLMENLKGKYLRETAKVYANVALATEGETKEDVLGSGDASIEFQKFSLHEAPLTYVPSISSSGSTSTLRIYVNEVQWREVASLYEYGPKDRVFTVRRDDTGIATVLFGNGLHGSRLPTGRENVKAVYRKGLGKSGNIDAGKLSLQMKVPLGVKSVKNPMAASGGADPEDLESARTNAPLDMFTLGRLVSLQDYECFARAFAGIGKAMATWTWNGQARGVFVTIAGQDGDEVLENSILFKNLLAEMRKAGDPSIAIDLKSYRKSFFRASASVKINPDYQTDLVLSQVKLALLSKFSFSARNFGQDVYLSEVMGTIQSVPGVMAAEVSQLYKITGIMVIKPSRLGEVLADMTLCAKKGIEKVIPASAPRGGEKRESSDAAELLIIDPNQPLDSLGVML